MSARSTLAPTPLRIGLVMLGAPAAWAGQGLLGWYVSSRACAMGQGAATIQPLMPARAIEIVISIVALVVAAGGLRSSWRSWHSFSDARTATTRPHSVLAFLAAAATIVSAAFLVGIGWASLAPFILPMCEAMR